MLPPHLARAYAATEYSVAGQVARPGRRCGGIDGVLAGMGARQAVFVTAWNPGSRRMPASWNERRMAMLRAALGRRTVLPGRSRWHRWSEAHFVAGGDARPICGIARRFGQNAVLLLRRGQAPRLVALV